VQADLLDALLDAGTPVVVVVVSGRPYALGDVADRAVGLVQAFMPGEEGGEAIAGVLSGRLSPGGKLPVQIPRHPGGQPHTYLQPPLGSAESTGISSVDATPLFPFGYGRPTPRSRSTTCGSAPPEVPTDGEFEVLVRVRNTGTRAGDEVVQLPARRGRADRPTGQQLTGFAGHARAGDSVDVSFRVHADRAAYTDRELSGSSNPGT
jgi:beta-glucosidase